MHIISRKPFRDAASQFPNARTAIEDCYRVLKNGTFNTPDELRQLFPSLAKYQDRWWAIDISGSDLRLIALIEFKHNRLYVRDIVSSGQLPRHSKDKTVQAITITDDSGDQLDLNQLVDAIPEPEELLGSPNDAPVIRLINAILTKAIRKNVSDVHIEPFENRLVVRYRVDGVMQKILDPPREIAPLIISRIKVMAKLDIAERCKPADGRIKLRVAGSPVDIRVSILPAGHGERVVLRILDKQADWLGLENLGMPELAYANFTRTLTLSHGIILVAGPAGSGKTTTLYASLRHLKESRKSILTIEDPIENCIDGIGQTQVNNKVELDFATGLRALLRQDPDIVMVGEIRDTETAEVAVQASLTGHLVLSTLHANTVIGAMTRLRDMGIEPFLLASSLVALVAQRLVRVLCPHCKKRSQTPTHAELKILGATVSQASNVYTQHGCGQCNHTGYIGRTGIYEVVEVDEQMRTMILDGKSEQDMEKYARTRHPGLQDDGARLVLEGKTSLEEMLRVTREVATLSDPPVFTEAMALKVKALIEEEGNPDLMLRLFVTGDVWSGFKYGFTFDEAISEGDVEIKKEGVKFLIDTISFQYLAGTEIDYTEGLYGSQFVVRNPNATTPSTTN